MDYGELDLIKVDLSNIDSVHICCAIGNDKVNTARANTKKDWMKERFGDGLVFKRFDERGKFFIEYIPSEKVWKPIIASNFMVINCLWVSGRFKGKGLGKKLLYECIDDSKESKKDGVCVVTGKKRMGFLTDKKFFGKFGFETTDTAYPYFELLVFKFNPSSSSPKFTKTAKEGIFNNKADFSFVFSNQCPYMEEYATLMVEMCKKRGKTTEIIKLKNHVDAQKFGSPFGTFGVYYEGNFVHHEPMPEKKFNKLLDKLISK
jgi:ribosomal protein S18 acetylase RimI-like enzyme